MISTTKPAFPATLTSRLPPPLTPEEECMKERYWSYFLASSLITFLVGLIAILLWKLVIHFSKPDAAKKIHHEQGDDGRYGEEDTRVGVMTRLKWAAEECISGQTNTGKILVSMNTLYSLRNTNFPLSESILTKCKIRYAVYSS